MKAGERDRFTWQHQLQTFFKYRSTPHSTTGQSPASLFLGRPLHTRFDLLRPTVGERVRGVQTPHKQHHDTLVHYRDFSVGSQVMVQDGRDKLKWSPGTVLEHQGPVSHLVQMESGMVHCKHVDHLREYIQPHAAHQQAESVKSRPVVMDSLIVSLPRTVTLQRYPCLIPRFHSPLQRLVLGWTPCCRSHNHLFYLTQPQLLLRFSHLLHQLVTLGVTDIRWTDLLFLNIVLSCLKNL